MIDFSPRPWGEGGESSDPSEGFLHTEPRNFGIRVEPVEQSQLGTGVASRLFGLRSIGGEVSSVANTVRTNRPVCFHQPWKSCPWAQRTCSRSQGSRLSAGCPPSAACSRHSSADPNRRGGRMGGSTFTDLVSSRRPACSAFRALSLALQSRAKSRDLSPSGFRATSSCSSMVK
jgi:hypothetical protein